MRGTSPARLPRDISGNFVLRAACTVNPRDLGAERVLRGTTSVLYAGVVLFFAVLPGRARKGPRSESRGRINGRRSGSNERVGNRRGGGRRRQGYGALYRVASLVNRSFFVIICVTYSNVSVVTNLSLNGPKGQSALRVITRGRTNVLTSLYATSLHFNVTVTMGRSAGGGGRHSRANRGRSAIRIGLSQPRGLRSEMGRRGRTTKRGPFRGDPAGTGVGVAILFRCVVLARTTHLPPASGWCSKLFHDPPAPSSDGRYSFKLPRKFQREWLYSFRPLLRTHASSAHSGSKLPR